MTLSPGNEASRPICLQVMEAVYIISPSMAIGDLDYASLSLSLCFQDSFSALDHVGRNVIVRILGCGDSWTGSFSTSPAFGKFLTSALGIKCRLKDPTNTLLRGTAQKLDRSVAFNPGTISGQAHRTLGSHAQSLWT